VVAAALLSVDKRNVMRQSDILDICGMALRFVYVLYVAETFRSNLGCLILSDLTCVRDIRALRAEQSDCI